MAIKRGLGRGISALIPDVDTSGAHPGGALLQVAVEQIRTNPHQPRKVFSEEEIAQLADSIREQGVLQPLLVSREGDGFTLIAGERRLRAATHAGVDTVPVIVREVDERARQEIALIENLQREDLNVIEEAQAYASLIERFSYTQEEVATRVGKSRTVVTNALRILKLPREIQEDLLKQRITMGHARAYLGLETAAEQAEVHKLVVQGGHSVRQTEQLVQKRKQADRKKKRFIRPGADKAQYAHVQDTLRKHLGTKVNILGTGSRGRIVIEFYSPEEFERLYDLLRG